jgi:hypothetical protein
MSTLLALTYCAPVTKEVHEGTSLTGVEGDTEKKFGPLKVILEGITALYANHEVRLNLSSQASPLMNTLAEDHRCDRKPPLARSVFGRMFQFTSQRCGRSETPRRIDMVCHCPPLFPLLIFFQQAQCHRGAIAAVG